MNYSILKRTEKFLVRSFQLQLYLTLISGPILVYWGLPISLASPIGNIVFHPLLTLFLFLSSLIFFCQILHIPHGICIYGLQKTSHLFHYLLGLGSQQWLMGFIKPPLWILCCPWGQLHVFCCKKTRTPYRSIRMFTYTFDSIGLLSEIHLQTIICHRYCLQQWQCKAYSCR